MILSGVPRVAIGAAIASAAAVLIGISALAAGTRFQPTTAASPSPSASQQGKSQAYCDKFVDHLAKDLGKSSSDVRNALKQAASQTLDDAVQAGDLTKTQADGLRTRLDDKALCSGRLLGLGHHKGRHLGEGLPPIMGAYSDAAAKALGISTDQLKADLARGMTLHQVADSKGISEPQFRAALIQNLTASLDQAVKDGKLTKGQETKLLQRLQNGPLPLWDQTGRRHPRPATSPRPTT